MSKKELFGESPADIKAIKAIQDKAANAHFQPGAMHLGRAIDPLDYDKWERQRAARKAKNNTIDPNR